MDMMRYEKIRDEVIDDKHGGVKLKNGGKQLQEPPSSPSPPSSAPSSPNHEFSFTVSLHSSSVETPPVDDENKAKSPPAASFAVADLSPADEIFFHGHLLPLHLLSHLPAVPPRSSTNSLDSFTLPLKNETCLSMSDTCLSPSEEPTCFRHVVCDPRRAPVLHGQNHVGDSHQHNNYCQRNDRETRTRPTKSNKSSFSLFGLQKWRKSFEVKEKDQEKRKLRFVDVSNVLKRYMRMVRPLLTFGSRSKGMHFQKQSHSFSGNTSFRDKDLTGRRRIQYSAPASMRASPTNSGHLLSSNNARIATSTSDSTMEELQAAIQAAIAHCKNSIAMEDKKKSHD